MGANYIITVTDAAENLGCTKSYIQRLIRQKRLDAVLQNAPVRYYLIDPDSLEKSKSTPKNKGGRPPKQRK
jgi:hypothetical protein